MYNRHPLSRFWTNEVAFQLQTYHIIYISLFLARIFSISADAKPKKKSGIKNDFRIHVPWRIRFDKISFSIWLTFFSWLANLLTLIKSLGHPLSRKEICNLNDLMIELTVWYHLTAADSWCCNRNLIDDTLKCRVVQRKKDIILINKLSQKGKQK